MILRRAFFEEQWVRCKRTAGNPYIQSFFLFAVVFISRLPFCKEGYGTESDAYRIVSAARQMSETLDYVCRRPPCHPIPVLTYAVLYPTSCMVFNAVTALLSAIAAVAFAMTLRSVGIRNHFLAGAALATVPIVYINSTNSMDYMWALCFAMLSVAATVSRAPVKAGIALGLSAGCRLEYGALLLPSLLYMALSAEHIVAKKKSRIHSAVSMTLATIISALVSFVPVLWKYGTGIILNKFKMTGSSDDVVQVFFMPAFELFGGIGTVTLALLFVFALCESIVSRTTRKRIAAMPQVKRAFLFLCLAATTIFGLGYLRAPFKAAYLISFIPFVIGLLAVVLEEMSWGRRVLVFGFIASLLSPFVLDAEISNGADLPYARAAKERPDVDLYLEGPGLHVYAYWKGPLLRDNERRMEARQKYSVLREHITTLGEAVERGIVLVTGAMGPRLEVELGPELDPRIILVGSIKNMKELQRYKLSQRRIYFLSGVDKYNKERHGIDLKLYGAFLLR